MYLHRSRPFTLGTLWRAQKACHVALIVSHHRGQRFDELPQDCFVLWCLLVSAICILCGTTLPHDRLGSLKTPILQEILKIQNLLRVEHCALLEVIRLFQSVGCVRN